MMRIACVIGVTVAVFGAPALARADVLGDYGRLAKLNVHPAPLVPTFAPGVLAPIDRTVQLDGSRRKNGYSVRLVHTGPAGPDAVIAVQGGQVKTMKATLREDRRLAFKVRRTRVRGHAGYLLTRNLGRTERWLKWVEGGVVYGVGSATPKKVSLAQLRSTARALERLGRSYVGSTYDDATGLDAGAVIVTTARTITADVTWSAGCVMPGGFAGSARAGTAHPTLVRRSGTAFSFDIAQTRVGSDPWSGTISGTLTGTTGTLSLQASGTFEGAACTTGPVTLSLGPLP